MKIKFIRTFEFNSMFYRHRTHKNVNNLKVHLITIRLFGASI